MSDILKKFPDISELKRLIMLTSQTVWKCNITQKEIDRWLDNFTGEIWSKDEEKVLALWLLLNFVHYNEDEVRHLCRILMRGFIHKMLTEKLSDIDVSKLISKTRFLPLGKPSESSGYILYYFRQENDLNVSYFNPPQSNELDSVDNLVFIDDATLTAGPDGQAYIQLKNFTKAYATKKIVFLTLIASKDSIVELEKIGVKVIATITLDERNKCFCSNSDIFHTYQDCMEPCKKFALHYGKKIYGAWPLGYKNGEYVFGFFYNTPDNTLPIFWATNNNWNPIFRRYDKNYKREGVIIDGRFI